MNPVDKMRPFKIASLDEYCVRAGSAADFWPPKQPRRYVDIWPGTEERIELDEPIPVEHRAITEPEHYFIDHREGCLRTQPYRMAYLENVDFKTRAGIIFLEPDVVLAESWYDARWFHKALERKLFPPEDMLLLPAEEGRVEMPVCVDETFDTVVTSPCFLLGHNPFRYMANYSHWILEILPRLAALEVFPSLRKVKILLPEKLNGFQRDSLVAFGISAKVLHPIQGWRQHLAKVFVPTYPAAGGYSRRQIEWLRETLPRVLKISPSGEPSRKLYISREDAESRRVTNHEELERYLRQEGFETIVPGKMTLREQVQTFGEASAILAPHGAACVNMIFAPPGARVIELLPVSYQHPMFEIIARLSGHRYSRICPPHDPQTKDMMVDLSSVKAALHVNL